MLPVPPNIVPSVIPPFTGFYGYTDIQPFSYVSTMAYDEILQGLRRWALGFVPEINDKFDDILVSWVGKIVEIRDIVNAGLADQAGTTDAAIAAQQAAIQAALDAQQASIDQQLSDTLAGLAGGSISITDPVVKNAISTAGTQTRIALDALYAAKSVVDGIVTLTTTGRLSQATLDADYAVSDGDLAALVSASNSATRTAFNNIYSRIQFQVSNGYIQWKYVGDSTWTNLENIADLMGATGPTGTPGAPGGAAEMAYAEVNSGGTISVATGTGTQDVPGLTLSFTMPSRPVMLEFQGLIRYVSSNLNGADAAVQIIETTGGGSTNVAEFHSGVAGGSGDYKEIHGKRRITGAAGVVRSFKVTCRKDASVAWTLSPASAYPIWVGAYQV